MILLLLSATHARFILTTVLLANRINISLNLSKRISILLVLVPAQFHTAKEIKLLWFVGPTVWLISWNLQMAVAFYVLLHSLWALEVRAKQIVGLDITLKLPTEYVLFVTSPVLHVLVPTLKIVQVVNRAQVINFYSSRCVGHFVPKDSILTLHWVCALYVRVIYTVLAVLMIVLQQVPTAQLVCMDTSITPLIKSVALLV